MYFEDWPNVSALKLIFWRSNECNYRNDMRQERHQLDRRQSSKSPRWRVRTQLPSNSEFCSYVVFIFDGLWDLVIRGPVLGVLIRQCTSLGDRADIFNHWSTSTVVKMVFGRKRIMLILDIFTQIRWKSEDNLKRIYDSDRLSSLIISRPKPQILLRFRWGFQEMQNHLTLVSVGTAEK